MIDNIYFLSCWSCFCSTDSLGICRHFMIVYHKIHLFKFSLCNWVNKSHFLSVIGLLCMVVKLDLWSVWFWLFVFKLHKLCDLFVKNLWSNPDFLFWTQAGHGWDVKSVDWHPTKSLLVSGLCLVLGNFFQTFPWMILKISIALVENLSGGKDNLVKLWDAKTGKELCSLWVQYPVLKN